MEIHMGSDSRLTSNPSASNHLVNTSTHTCCRQCANYPALFDALHGDAAADLRGNARVGLPPRAGFGVAVVDDFDGRRAVAEGPGRLGGVLRLELRPRITILRSKLELPDSRYFVQYRR